MSPRAQSRALAPIAQPVKAGSSDQVPPVPEPSGRTSWRVTFVAVPAPVLLTVMSNPMSSPALTGPTGLASLTTSGAGAGQLTGASSLASGGVAAVAVA